MTKKRLFVLALLVLSIGLGGCRNETQNRIRRSIQDFTADKMYISVYSWGGQEIFSGVVDGKVTRSSNKLSNTNETAQGGYVYWFDDRGRYHQTDLPYLVTSYDRNETVRAP